MAQRCREKAFLRSQVTPCYITCRVHHAWPGTSLNANLVRQAHTRKRQRSRVKLLSWVNARHTSTAHSSNRDAAMRSKCGWVNARITSPGSMPVTPPNAKKTCTSAGSMPVSLRSDQRLQNLTYLKMFNVFPVGIFFLMDLTYIRILKRLACAQTQTHYGTWDNARKPARKFAAA